MQLTRLDLGLAPFHKLMQVMQKVFHTPGPTTSIANLGVVGASTRAKAQLTKGWQIFQGRGILVLSTGRCCSSLLTDEPLHLVLEIKDHTWRCLCASLSQQGEVGWLPLLKVFIGQGTILSVGEDDDIKRAVAPRR